MGNQFEHITVGHEGPVTHVRLERPDVHNAFNRVLIRELKAIFEQISREESGSIRVVVLSGAGPTFCAGADVNWMRASLEYSRDENLADAAEMADMFNTIDRCPVPVVGRVQGAALGGGAGLAAVCDIVIAEERAKFAFSEAKLGIAPAVISPFVLRKIGQSNARALFLTAERFDAIRAREIGLIHNIVPATSLDEAVARTVRELLTSSPVAIERAKMLIREVPHLPADEVHELTTKTIAALRTSPSGQEGLRAFLDKRKPEWAP